MKRNNSTSEETSKLFLVPETLISRILESQERILEAIGTNNHSKNSLGDYITEPEAKKLLGRKATWFWNLRKDGKIPFNKIGNKIFYKKTDIISLLDNNRKGGNNE